ncbi:peptidase S8 [Arthrobacter citreus]|nr:peptidase S8 [Arthrobacter citreus]
MKKIMKFSAVFSLAASMLTHTPTDAAVKNTSKTKFLNQHAPLPFLTNKEQISDSTYVVKYNSFVSNSIHDRAGMSVVKSFPSLGYDIVKLKNGKKLSTALSVYNQYGTIKSVSPSVQYKLMSSAANPKEDEAYHLSQLNISAAQKLVAKKAITVAVIDQGVDRSHPDLTGQLLGSYNVVDPATQAVRDFHGTHVTGIIAAKKDNKIGAYGINPNAKILSVDVFNGNEYTSDYSISEGILYAVSKGAKVINMSLGGTMYSQLLDDTIQYAISKGVVVVAAAGNSGTNEYSYPASYDGVISVGATDSEKHLASFSTYGPGVDVVAPGEFIYSTIYAPTIGSTYYYLSGTSMATPIVSGIASLLKTKYPNLSSYDIEQILEETATDKGSSGYDIYYGYGLVDPVKALKYDMKKLVSYKKPSASAIIDSAAAVQLSENGEASYKGTITKPHQINRYKLNLKAGEDVGLTLKMAKNYDDQLSLRFYEGTSKTSSKPLIIDDVLAGIAEGTIYTAPKDGTLVIEVMDKNSRYSSKGSSTFSLSIKKKLNINEETGAKNNPIEVTSLPFDATSLNDDSFLLFNKGNTGARYISYRPTEDEKILLSMGSIPGLNTSITVYTKDKWDEYINTSNAKQPLPLVSIDHNGKSEGEKGAVTLKKDTDYIIELSSAPISVFSLPLYDEQPDAPYIIPGSFEKVAFKMSKLDLPADEDGLVNTFKQLDLSNGLINQLDDSTPIDDVTTGMDPEDVQQVLKNAIPITGYGKRPLAYMQDNNDVDWYKYTPSKNEFIHLNINGNKNQQFDAQAYVYNSNTGAFEYVTKTFNYYTTFQDRDYTDNNKDLFALLDSNKTYYFRVSSVGGALDEPYQLTFQGGEGIAKDKYEPNNSFASAKTLKSYDEIQYGNFSSSSDEDYFYFKNTSTSTVLKGFEFMALPVDPTQSGGMYSSLFNDLPVNITVYEDTNGNKRLDGTEREKASYYQNYGDITKSSFQAKPNHGYFFEIANSYPDIANLHEYIFRFYSLNRADEDAKAKYTNGIPSIRLPLRYIGKNTYIGLGYLNANVANGDKDYFKFVNDKDRYVSYNLEMPMSGMNGKITFYDSKGKNLGTFNRYTYDDPEVGQIRLKKGTYYIRVEEAKGISDYDQYQLTITKN